MEASNIAMTVRSVWALCGFVLAGLISGRGGDAILQHQLALLSAVVRARTDVAVARSGICSNYKPCQFEDMAVSICPRISGGQNLQRPWDRDPKSTSSATNSRLFSLALPRRPSWRWVRLGLKTAVLIFSPQ